MSSRIDILRSLTITDVDRVNQSPSRKALIWIMLAAIGGAALATTAMLMIDRKVTVPATVAAPPAVSRSAARDAVGDIASAGYVVATRRATVAAEITGRLASLLVQEGDVVARGQLLAVIDARTADADIATTIAQVRSARTQIDVLTADYADVRAQRLRADELHLRGFVSEAMLMQARAREASLNAQIARARANVDVSRVDNRRRIVERNRYEIRAPFGGVVTSRNAQVGEIISPISAGGGFTRTGVYTITDMQSLVVDVDVGEKFMSRIRPGQSVRLELDAFPDRTFRGAVVGTLPLIIRERASVTVRLRFTEPVVGVLPDMAVRATFLSSDEGGKS